MKAPEYQPGRVTPPAWDMVYTLWDMGAGSGPGEHLFERRRMRLGDPARLEERDPIRAVEARQRDGLRELVRRETREIETAVERGAAAERGDALPRRRPDPRRRRSTTPPAS